MPVAQPTILARMNKHLAQCNKSRRRQSAKQTSITHSRIEEFLAQR
jgi:hypothetical protein